MNTSECTFLLILGYHVHLVNRSFQEIILLAVQVPVNEIWSIWKPWSFFYTLRALITAEITSWSQKTLEFILSSSLGNLLGTSQALPCCPVTTEQECPYPTTLFKVSIHFKVF